VVTFTKVPTERLLKFVMILLLCSGKLIYIPKCPDLSEAVKTFAQT